jgi:hypothetical protein
VKEEDDYPFDVPPSKSGDSPLAGDKPSDHVDSFREEEAEPNEEGAESEQVGSGSEDVGSGAQDVEAEPKDVEAGSEEGASRLDKLRVGSY